MECGGLECEFLQLQSILGESFNLWNQSGEMFCSHVGFQNILVLPCLADHHHALACAAREIVVCHITFVCQRLLHQFTAQSLQLLSLCCILKFEKNIQSDHVFLICLMLLKLLLFSAAKLHNFLPTACSDNTFNLLEIKF